MIEHINLKSDDSESNDSKSDDSESEGFAKDGYSLLSHRLENPLEYYCKKKYFRKNVFYVGESRLSHCLLDYHELQIPADVNGTL